MQFTAPLVLSGKTATGLPVPESIVHALAAGRPVRISRRRYFVRLERFLRDFAAPARRLPRTRRML